MERPPSPPALELDNLTAVRVLGKGALGTVFLVHDPSLRSLFALKVVDKSAAEDGGADRRARWEIAVLRRLAAPAHPFLPALISTAETDEFLAWAVPFCPGGDLNVLRRRQTDRVFSPAVIRFYAAEIVSALERLHAAGIVYRDLKPENVLIQRSGHVTLTDFDLSRALAPRTVKSLIADPPDPPAPRRTLPRLIAAAAYGGRLKKVKSARVSPVSRRKASFSGGERSNSFVGTEEYVSPEVVRGDGHEFAVDWWALGVLAYEMLYGRTPFRGKHRKETFANVLMRPPEFVGQRTALTDLIARLLEKDPRRRLGYAGGAAEIKNHPFFRGLRWDLLTQVARPPFLPAKDEEEDRCFAGGMGIREYFQRLRAPPPPSFPPSPDRPSFTEF